MPIKEIDIGKKEEAKEVKKENYFLEVVVFIFSLTLIIGLTFLTQTFSLTKSIVCIRALTFITYILFMGISVGASALVGEINIFKVEFRSLFIQLLFGLIIALILWFAIGILPILVLKNNTTIDFNLSNFIYATILYFFFVGPGEEMFFRGYVEYQFEKWFKNVNYLAPICSALLFGALHLINGVFAQFILTTLIGLVLGYSKFYLKKCSLVSVSFAHGLYDLLNQSLKYFSF